MAETGQKETANGTSAALLEPTPVPSPNIEGETEQPIQRTVTTVDKLQVKAKRGPGRPVGSGSQQLATRPARDKCAVLIDSSVGDPSYRITCEKRSPELKQIGDEIPQGPMSEIQSFLEHKYGSGSYRLTVMQDGIVIPPLEGGSCEIRIASKSTEPEVSTTIKEQSEKAKLLKLKVTEAEAEAELARTRRRIEKEEADAKREAKDAEVSPVLAEIAELKAKLEEATKPKESPWTIEKIAVLIGALAPIIQMFKPQKDDSIEKVLNTINETNRQTNEKLIKLLEQKSEKKSDEFGIFELYNRVKKDVREEQKALDDRLEKILATRGGDDDDEVDPNNVWGSLMALGVKGIIKYVKSGQAGAAVTEAIARISAEAGKRPEDLTAADEAKVQAAIATAAAEEKAKRQQLPVPIQRPPVQQQPQRPIVLPPPIRLQQPQRVGTVTGEKPGPTAQAPQAGTPPTKVEQNAVGPVAPEQKPIEAAAPVVGSAGAEQSIPVVAAPSFKLSTPELEEDLVLEIEKSIKDMIQDIGSERVLRGSLVWIDEALDRWNMDFLKHLESTPSHMERYKIIRSKVKPKLLEELDTALMNAANKADAERTGESKYLWNNFHNSFEVLIRAFAERRKEQK